MTTAYVVVVALALLPQMIFSFLYWRWIPYWVNNPYGRLSQLGAWCHIIFLFMLLSFLVFGEYFNRLVSEYIFLASFFPLIFYGILQLILLRRAVNESKERSEV